MKVLLSLDMSTTCTGWSVFDVETKTLVSYGTIKGKNVKDTSSYRALLKKMELISFEIRQLILNYKPTYIVIEEIAGSKNRIGQKTLDMLHGIVWKAIDEFLDIVDYYDVSGIRGWRTDLGLKLTDADKLSNKEAKKLNPKLGKGVSKLPIYGPKDLAARHANRKYGLNLDPQMRQFDADIADSVSMGDAWLTFRCPNYKK